MPLPKPVDNIMRLPCPMSSSKGRQSGSSFGTFAHEVKEDVRTKKQNKRGLDFDDEAVDAGDESVACVVVLPPLPTKQHSFHCAHKTTDSVNPIISSMRLSLQNTTRSDTHLLSSCEIPLNNLHCRLLPHVESTTRIRRANATEGVLSPRHSGPRPQAPTMNRGKWAWSLYPAAGISWIETDGRRRTCNTTTTQSYLSSRPAGGGFGTGVHCRRSFCRHAQWPAGTLP